MQRSVNGSFKGTATSSRPHMQRKIQACVVFTQNAIARVTVLACDVVKQMIVNQTDDVRV